MRAPDCAGCRRQHRREDPRMHRASGRCMPWMLETVGQTRRARLRLPPPASLPGCGNLLACWLARGTEMMSGGLMLPAEKC